MHLRSGRLEECVLMKEGTAYPDNRDLGKVEEIEALNWLVHSIDEVLW